MRKTVDALQNVAVQTLILFSFWWCTNILKENKGVELRREQMQRGEGKKTRGKRKRRKWGPIKICTATLTYDNTFKNKARTLTNEKSLLKPCAWPCVIQKEGKRVSLRVGLSTLRSLSSRSRHCDPFQVGLSTLRYHAMGVIPFLPQILNPDCIAPVK